MASAETPQVNVPSDSRSLAVIPGDPPKEGLVAVSVPLSGSSDFQMPDLRTYVHSLRRHWVMSLSIGLLLGGVLAIAAWFGVGARYTASSHLRVDLQEKTLAFKSDAIVPDRDRFEIFKNTQRELLLSRFVLLAALRRPEVQKIPVIQEEQRSGDAVEWLYRRLAVSFPGRAEVMEVSMTRWDGNEAATLVSSVVDSYINEVVNVERDNKLQRLKDLEHICAEKELQIRSKRQELKNLASNAGSSETEMVTLQQKLVLEELALRRQEWAKAQFEMRKVEADLKGAQALVTAIDTMEVPAQELDELIMMDPVTRQVSMELAFKKMDQVMTEGTVAPGVRNRYAGRYDKEVEMLQRQYDERLGTLATKVREKKRAAISLKIVELETALALMKEQEEQVSKEINQMRETAQKFGNSSVELEMLRSELKQMEFVQAELVNEREKVRVELKSPPRVTLLDKAEEPSMPSNLVTRVMLTILGALGGIIAPAIGIAIVDSRAHRINTVEDVSRGLQVPVIGSVPLIPSRVLRQLGTPGKQHEMWQVRLTESVDGISARLLRKADREQCRVIMISSAISGEGKTTLATQLALSLARANRRTVLVDFDLRRPAFDEVFRLALEPGVCDVLRQSGDVSSLVQPTETENLSVLTAGRWDRPALASLSNGSAAKMFKQLRDEFEFVIVDTSPLLPVADARFVSQHVDTVVLSVLRDISKAPKIQAACDILAAFGVQSVEAVVTGPNCNVYGKHMAYESTITA